MTWTRLINVTNGQLEESSIHNLSPFLAISHTWAEALFPPNLTFDKQPGAQAIKCVLEKALPSIRYCWIDTLCIDQEDPEDKRRQIPLMGEIYGKAEAVVIVYKFSMGLTQQQIDSISEDVEDAVEMYREENWTTEGEKWRNGQRRQRLKEAMDCLELFTRSPWATRVWTLQEFILAKATIWIGGDLVPLRISEELFIAIPDICDTLDIAECIMGKYRVLYQYYRGMAGARLGLIDRTRVMELLGNRIASLPVDDVFGTMAASGVVIDQLGIETREEAWRLWWESAVREGHVRWALLPPAMPGHDVSTNQERSYHNCAIPACSTRHLASSTSGLDTVTPLGPIEVEDGTVTMDGRWAGICIPIRKLGRVHQDADGLLHRHITLILFAANKWDLSLRIARAFGGGRYTQKKIYIIAQILKHNFYRAKFAVLSHTESDFTPRFRNMHYKFIWSDFILLQLSHMMLINDGIAFLAELQNDTFKTDIVLVTGTNNPPNENLIAVDFGAVNASGRTLLTVLEISQDIIDPHSSTPPPFHKIGMTVAVGITNLETAQKFSGFMLSDTKLYRFRFGGRNCVGCKRGNYSFGNGSSEEVASTVLVGGRLLDERSRRRLRMDVRRQSRALKGDARQRGSVRRRVSMRRGRGLVRR